MFIFGAADCLVVSLCLGKFLVRSLLKGQENLRRQLQRWRLYSKYAQLFSLPPKEPFKFKVKVKSL